MNKQYPRLEGPAELAALRAQVAALTAHISALDALSVHITTCDMCCVRTVEDLYYDYHDHKEFSELLDREAAARATTTVPKESTT